MSERTESRELYDNHGELLLTGSSNAYVATTARPVTGYYRGLRLLCKANHTNTGAATINVNGIGAKAIRKGATTALVAGEILSGKYYDLVYDDVNDVFQVAALASGSAVSGPASSTDNALVRFDGTTGTLIQSSAVTLDDSAILAPVTSDGGALGSSSKQWSDLSLADGGTITFNASYALTHSTGLLTANGTFASDGGLKSANSLSGIGYITGAGGTVTQATSKSTGVTLNKVCGTITLNNASLAGGATVGFTFSNSAITATDVPHIIHSSAGTGGAYRISVDTVAAGSCAIRVTNLTGGALAEAIVLSFFIFKAVTS